jgi:hypothetical protein
MKKQNWEKELMEICFEFRNRTFGYKSGTREYKAKLLKRIK